MANKSTLIVYDYSIIAQFDEIIDFKKGDIIEIGFKRPSNSCIEEINRKKSDFFGKANLERTISKIDKLGELSKYLVVNTIYRVDQDNTDMKFITTAKYVIHVIKNEKSEIRDYKISKILQNEST